MLKKTSTLPVAILAAATLAACGSSTSTPVAQVTHATYHTIHANLSVIPPQCSVAVVLTSPQSISLYQSSGDPVATDPTGSYGAKIIAQQGYPESTCLTAARSALAGN